MRDKRGPTFPLPFARKPAPVKEMAQCRRADNEPVLFIVRGQVMVELLRYRIRNLDRPLGTVPEGVELN